MVGISSPRTWKGAFKAGEHPVAIAHLQSYTSFGWDLGPAVRGRCCTGPKPVLPTRSASASFMLLGGVEARRRCSCKTSFGPR